MARTFATPVGSRAPDLPPPKVMVVANGEARDRDYETDVLAAIDWRGFDPKEIAARVPENAQAAESQLQRIRLAKDGDELFVGETVAASTSVSRSGSSR